MSERLAAARIEYRRLLNEYAECMRTGEWPGYRTDIQLLQLPRWAQAQINASSTQE